MRRIEPAFPDLLPVTHRLGPLPAPQGVRLDPVEMRLVRDVAPDGAAREERTVPRRPIRILAHSELARAHREFLARLVAAGCGLLIVLDDELRPEELPDPIFPAQLVVVAPWLPPLWGGRRLSDLGAWRARGVATGVLLGLAPALGVLEQARNAVSNVGAAAADFVLAVPVAVSPEDRHRIWDNHGGEAGDGALEDLLFHSDLAQLALVLEREVSRACRASGVREGLPGPATANVSCHTFAAAASLLLWARRLDLLDAMASPGWQLRRAAHALLASGRDPRLLLAEDNLRVIPGFNPWVEAFARSLWSGGGEPFEEVLGRWLGA